jgi:hypothetical protein
MCRALVLVAGLYVFLAPVVTHKAVTTSMKGSNGNTEKGNDTTNNRAIECSLCAPFLLSSLFFYYFFFFLSKLFLDFALLIFFLIKEHIRTNLKKFELNWTKDMAYKSRIVI